MLQNSKVEIDYKFVLLNWFLKELFKLNLAIKKIFKRKGKS